MPHFPIRYAAGAVACVLFSISASAATALPQTSTAPQEEAPAAHYDPEQLPATEGVLSRFTLTARGDIDGLILEDGTEIKTARDLSTQLAFAIKPGDPIIVHGLRAAALPLVRAMSVTDQATRRTVSDATVPMDLPPAPPAPPPGGGPVHARSADRETSGRVLMALHGEQGELNGVLLDNGDILRFPPGEASQFVPFLQTHTALVARGAGTSTAMGTVVAVSELGPSRDHLVPLGPAHLLDDRALPGPARRPPPPPRLPP